MNNRCLNFRERVQMAAQMEIIYTNRTPQKAAREVV